jgi:hypothetical protein
LHTGIPFQRVILLGLANKVLTGNNLSLLVLKGLSLPDRDMTLSLALKWG